ncbi:MAG TPA: response regulator [Hyphomonas sp.]|nr:response regulator [Hyphomonas sp.]
MLYQLITQELPYLRRYARAMTGDQISGDLCVEAMLQEHILTPRPIETPLPADRVALFGLLDSVLANPNTLPGLDETRSVFRNMSSLARRALFLTAVEQFDRQSVQAILNLTSEQLDSALAEAERDLASALSTSVLIIEDEPMIAFQLKEIVESLGHTMAARATTRDEAVNLARRHSPGLILVDIQLADGSSGLDAMSMITQFHSAPSVVITAYPERLLAGQSNEPAFLIPKPFRADHVKAIVSQALLAHTHT